MQKNYFINVTDYKVLLTVSYLNSLDYLPSSQGILKILNGVNDEETEMFSLCPTFQVLVSYNPKKLTRDINRLVTHGYIKKFKDINNNDYYFEVTEKGNNTLKYYKSVHKVNLKKHEINKTKSFIKRRD